MPSTPWGWRWSERPGLWQPMLTREEWEALQVSLSARKLIGTRRNVSDGWCRDVLRFRDRPGKIILTSIRDRAGRAECYGLRAPGQPFVTIRRKLLHDYAQSQLADLFSRPLTLLEAVRAETVAQAPRTPVAASGASQDVYEQVAALRQEMARLQELEFGEVDEERRLIWQRLGREKAQALKVLKRQIDLPPVSEGGGLTLSQLGQIVERVGDQFAAWWDGLDNDTRRDVAGAVFEVIEVTVTPHGSGRLWKHEISGHQFREWLLHLAE